MGSPPRLAPLLLLVLLLATGCGSDPLVIGFLGPLEGKFSDLGVQGRNGATLAIEEINAGGGLDGRPLRLEALNDANEAATAQVAIRLFSQKRITAVIGPMTSAVAVAVQPVAAAEGIVLLSPTVSSSLLSGRDDNFFRITATGDVWTASLARMCLAQGFRRMAIVSDLSNAAFAIPLAEAFASSLTAAGGDAALDLRQDSTRQPSWASAVFQVNAVRAQAVFASLSARDLALFARELRLSGSTIPIFSSMWAFTPEILQTGGHAVNGIVFAIGYDVDNPRPAFQDFTRRYRERFGYVPNFAACYGYEAAQTLALALRSSSGEAQDLIRALKALGQVDAVQGPLSFDAFGDVRRPYFLVAIRDQKFITLREITE